MSSPLGLYLGTENIDIVSLAGTFQRPKLTSFARTRLPAENQWRNQLRVEGPETGGPMLVGATDGLQAIARSIQNILQKLGIASPRAQVAIPSEAMVIRYFQMPTIPRHEWKMAIAFEAKKYLPFKLEELVTDYEVVVRRSDPGLMRIMFFGVKRNAIDTYLSLFQTAGITPLSLEPAPLSLMRLVRHTGQMASGQVAAILYLEHDSATISIARSDILYLSRNVSITPTTKSGEDPTPELLEALTHETRVSIDYYRRRFLGEPAVNKIIFFGKAADPNKIKEISSALGDLPIEAGDPFSKIMGAKAVPPGLAVVTGLALRGLDRKGREINLLPPEQRRGTGDILKPLIAELVAAALALMAWYGVSMADLNARTQKLTLLRNQQAWPEGVSPNAGVADLEQLQAVRNGEIRLLKTLQDPSVPTAQLLSALSKQIPTEIWLQSLLYRDTVQTNRSEHHRLLRLVGDAYADNRDLELERVNQLLAALRQEPFLQKAFKEFSLDSVQRTVFSEENATEFQMTCASHAEEIRGERSRP